MRVIQVTVGGWGSIGDSRRERNPESLGRLGCLYYIQSPSAVSEIARQVSLVPT